MGAPLFPTTHPGGEGGNGLFILQGPIWPVPQRKSAYPAALNHSSIMDRENCFVGGGGGRDGDKILDIFFTPATKSVRARMGGAAIGSGPPHQLWCTVFRLPLCPLPPPLPQCLNIFRVCAWGGKCFHFPSPLFPLTARPASLGMWKGGWRPKWSLFGQIFFGWY